MTTKHKTTHGGTRPGAGRKPKPKDRKFVKVLVSLPPDEIKWLRKNYPRKISTIISELVGVFMAGVEFGKKP